MYIGTKLMVYLITSVFVVVKLKQKPNFLKIVADGIVGIATHQHRFVKAIQPFQLVVA